MKQNFLLRNTLLYMPAQLLGPTLQFAVTVIWTHLFDPAVFGCVTFVVATQELTGGLGLGWWSIYMLRFRKGYADVERFRAMDARIVACGAASQALFALPALLMVGVTPDPTLLAATAIYLATRTVLNHYGELARSDHRIGVYTIAQLASPVAGSGLSILATLAFGADPAIAFAAMAIGQGLGVVAVAIGLGLRPRLGAFDAGIFRQAGIYGLPLVISALFVWAASNGARVLVEAGEGIECTAQDRHGHFAGQLDFRDVDGARRGLFHEALGALRDLLGFIAGAFEIRNRLRDRDEEAQVARGRLTARDDVAALFVDLDFHRVQTFFGSDHLVGDLRVEAVQRQHRVHDLRFDEAAHFENLRRNEVQVGIELTGEVFVGHVVLPSGTA